MTIEYNDKGKFFTNIITKAPVPVIIQTGMHRICGEIHIIPDERVKDELNHAEKFIAITNAVVYDGNDHELYRSQFLILNRDDIRWLIPERDLTGATPTGGQP